MPLSRRIKELKNKGYFTKRDLLNRLREEGFFCNLVSLWQYEKKGIISKPKRHKDLKDINKYFHFYTKEEIDHIVTELKLLPVKTRLNVTQK